MDINQIDKKNQITQKYIGYPKKTFKKFKKDFMLFSRTVLKF